MILPFLLYESETWNLNFYITIWEWSICLYLAITNTGLLISLNIPNKINNIGNFKCAVTTKYLIVIVKI